MDSITEAQRFVETLLEAGFEQENIRVFAGREMSVRVSQQPVVALVAEDPHRLTTADPSSVGVEMDRQEDAVEAGAGAKQDTGRRGWLSLFGSLSRRLASPTR